MKILIAEDEKRIATLVSKALNEAGFSTEVFSRGDDAWAALQSIPYDLAILDIMLPGLDGLAILRRIRDALNAVPVLVLSARGAVNERVEGLEQGADDYLAKPFSIEELVARVRTLLRRRTGESLTIYKTGDLLMDVASRRVSRDGRRIELTSREFSLLELLLRSPGHVFSRTQICEKVWNYHFDPGTNLVDVYVRRLRHKIDSGFQIRLIHTIRHVGYCLAESPP